MFLGQMSLPLKLFHRQQQLSIMLGLLLLGCRLLGRSGPNASLTGPEPLRSAGVSPAHTIAATAGTNRLTDHTELVQLLLWLSKAAQVALIITDIASPAFNLQPLTWPPSGLGIDQWLAL